MLNKNSLVLNSTQQENTDAGVRHLCPYQYYQSKLWSTAYARAARHVKRPLITDKQTITDKRTTQFFTIWHWPLTYDLDLQPQASHGQGRPSCQKSRSNVKQFKQESAHRQTDGRTLPNILSPLLRGRSKEYYFIISSHWSDTWSFIIAVLSFRSIFSVRVYG